MSEARRTTEAIHPRSGELDRLASEDALALFDAEDEEVVRAVRAARPDIARVVDTVAELLAAGGRLFYVGAGTSGRLGVLDASECPPTFQSPPDQVVGLIAGGPEALTRAVEGAEDSREAGRALVEQHEIGVGDALLGISAGGTAPFVRAALERARARGATTILLACVPRCEVPDEEHLSLRVVTGPELLAGSTRLKAGTATKLVLNRISTLVMVRLGKVHGNLMVDLDSRGNTKLERRALRILRAIRPLDEARARELLEAAGGQVKLAAVMDARNCDARAAAEHLTRSGGFLRAALDERT